MIRKLVHHSIMLGTSRTARHLYWMFVGNALSIILAFFATVLIARYLTKESFGIYLALFTFATLIADLADVGIGTSLSSFIPGLIRDKRDHEARQLLSQAYIVEIIIGSVLFLFIVIFSPILANTLFGKTSTLNLVLTGLMMILIQLTNFAILSLSSLKMFRENSLINIFYGIVRLALVAYAASRGTMSLAIVLVIYIVSSFLSWIYSQAYIKVPRAYRNLDKNLLKRLLRFSGFLGLQKMFVAIAARLDMLMLIPLAGAYEAGVYGAASRISQVYPFIISSFGQVLAPKMAEFVSVRTALPFLRKTLMVTCLMLFSLTLFYLLAKPVILLLFGVKYLEAIPVFKVLLLSIIGFILAAPFVSLLIYTLKKPHIIAATTFMQLLVITTSNLIFIPKYGRFGPAIGIGIANVLTFIFTASAVWYYMRKEK